jgi:RNA polymerase sigma-70 factor (ECF subfamily)
MSGQPARPTSPVSPAVLDAAIGGDRRAGDAVAAAIAAVGRDSTLLDDLAVAAAGGSAPALDLLLGAVEELGLARSAIRRIVLEPAAVDDVVQDVAISLAERIGTFRGEARFTTWLYQVCRFKSIDHLRRQRDQVSLDDDTSVEVPGSDAARISSMIATRTVLRAAIDELPDHYRGPLVLRDIERLHYDEIAQRAGIPLNTAKTRVARARALLAGKLATRPD